MYKIMTLIRDRGTSSLWSYYSEKKEVVVTPEVTDPTSGQVLTPAVTETVDMEYETDNMDDLESKVIELMADYTFKQIRVVEDLTYTIDLLFA